MIILNKYILQSMNEIEWSDLDKIMRILYKNRQGIAWYDVYTQLGFDRDYAQELYDIAEAHHYVKVFHKGVNFDNPDPHHVILTKEGLVFFSKTNFVEEQTKVNIPNNVVNNNIVNSPGVNIGDGNTSLINSTVPNKKGVLNNPWLVGIGVAIITAIIIYLIKKYFNIDLN